MATFINTFRPTPFGFFDVEIDFQDEADKMVTWIKRKLGDDVLSVELSSKQIWGCFEEATLEWGAIINEYHAKSTMANLLGQSTGSNVENKYPRESLEFLIRQAEPYSMAASYGGYQVEMSGSIDLVRGQQDYDLRTDLKFPDGVNSGTLLFDHVPSGSSQAGRPRVAEVFHFNPAVAFRFFDSTSAINFLNNEFSFESFTPETIFYVLPVFEDLLRSGQMQLSQRVRRSNYSYRLIGTKLRIFPVPTKTGDQNPRELWVRIAYPPDPLSPGFDDPSIDGISTLSNIPYGNINYNSINDVGRQWVRQYALALAMITLGFIRGKVRNIPVPNTDVQLNYDDLLSHGYEEKERLRTQIREQLESMTYDKLVEQQALKSENLIKQLRAIPIPNGWMIIPG